MDKGKRIAPNILENQWKEVRPQLTKQILAENPDKPLEVMRAMKQFDEINQQMIKSLEAMFAYQDYMMEMLEYEIAAKKSLLRQKGKQKNNKHLNIVTDGLSENKESKFKL